MTQANISIQQQATSLNLQEYLASYSEVVNTALDQFIPVVAPEQLYKSMRYSLLARSKRLRPILCIAACESVGGTSAMAIPTACALEMLHTMTLMQDDLPAMDDDDYRRGQLANHKVYGEANTVLASNGLMAYAFEIITEKTPDVSTEQCLKVVTCIARAIRYVASGQVVDLASEGNLNVSLGTLQFIHYHKTAALIEASVTAGSLLANADEIDLQRLRTYGKNIGLAFQIVDDILDVTSTPEKLGKSVGKDAQVQKATYPRILGLEESRLHARQLINVAKAELKKFGGQTSSLEAIADFVIQRV